jgi:hypothetical protein
MTLFFAKAAKDAVNIVFPVPPFPLITTICLTVFSPQASQFLYIHLVQIQGHTGLYLKVVIPTGFNSHNLTALFI